VCVCVCVCVGNGGKGERPFKGSLSGKKRSPAPQGIDFSPSFQEQNLQPKWRRGAPRVHICEELELVSLQDVSS
jgi:hypothetical protein